jgi:hypothetical protein
MKGKAAAVIATCLVVLSGMAQMPVAAGPAGPSGGPALPPARGSTPDNDSEPNDDFANATLITGNATFSGGVGQGDYDYFKISLNSGATADTLDVRLTPMGGGTAMYIYDPNFFFILQDGPVAGATMALNFTAQLTGYYYIYLPNLGPCNYSLTTTLDSASFTNDGDNDPAHAVNIETAGYPYSTISTLDNRTDIQDFYKVHLNYSALISSEVLKAFLIVPPASTFGFLLYPAGGYDSGQQPPMMPNTGQNQSLTFSPTASGDYYLRVWGPRGSGQYILNVSKASGTADQNDAIDYASSLEKSDAHWYNITGSLTLGIDQDDYFQIEGAVSGQVFNCTVTSTDYDARDRTPNIQISLWNNTQVPIPPDPVENVADPVAFANARVQDEGIVYIQLNITEWAGAYSLTVYTNSPPQAGVPPDNISFPENTNNTTIKLAQIFSDPENDPLEYSWEMFGEINGNLTVNISDDANRTVTLTPSPGFRGSGSMSWTATDPNGEIATVMIDNVAVTRINHRPYIDLNYTIPPISIPKGGWDNTTLNMNSIFIDPDDDKMKYAASGNVHIRVSFPLDPENGVWPTGEVMFLPELGWTGSEVITFNATDYTDDGHPMLNSQDVYVTAEVVEIFIEKVSTLPISMLNISEDDVDSSLNMKDFFTSNSPNDTFTIIYLPSNASRLNVTLATDGQLTVRPQPDWSGSETLRFRGTCLHGLMANLSLTVNVLPVNDPPAFTSWSPNQTSVAISEGESQKFKVTVSDKESAVNQLKLNWTLDGVKVSSLTDYEFIANYDTVVGQPSKTFNVTVTVNDTQALVSLNWTLTVNNMNRPPRDARITFPPDGQAYDEGAKVHLIGAAADDDGDPLTYQWFDGTKLLGSGPEFNATKLKTGKHNITLEVSDGFGSTNITITIKVNAKKTPGFEMAAVATAAIAALVLVAGRRRRK